MLLYECGLRPRLDDLDFASDPPSNSIESAIKRFFSFSSAFRVLVSTSMSSISLSSAIVGVYSLSPDLSEIIDKSGFEIRSNLSYCVQDEAHLLLVILVRVESEN